MILIQYPDSSYNKTAILQTAFDECGKSMPVIMPSTDWSPLGAVLQCSVNRRPSIHNCGPWLWSVITATTATLRWVSPESTQLTLYGHIKTAEQQHGDWYTGRWRVGCYIWYSEEGPGLATSPPSPFLAVPNVTAHPSTASVSTSYYSMWHYICLWILKG